VINFDAVALAFRLHSAGKMTVRYARRPAVLPPVLSGQKLQLKFFSKKSGAPGDKNRDFNMVFSLFLNYVDFVIYYVDFV
jgi:hypothetical protein